ncbi:MAG: 30S ribosomal protein S25e [Crenarchaeota archaeon]|nr:30S ribosomal protein S25e [Thermoproteota archaeon]
MARGKKGRKEETTETKRIVSLETQIEVTGDIVKRFERDLKRGSFKVITPYQLAQAYSIRISTARKLLRIASEKGLIKLYSGGRNPIYIKA